MNESSMILAAPRSSLGRLRTGVHAFRKLIADPADPVHGPLFQMCVERGLHERLSTRMRSTAEGARLLRLRPRMDAESVSLDDLGRLPEDTLGHAYSRYFRDQGIKPLQKANAPIDSDEAYVCTRLREAHDMLHLVTGYGTDEVGEIELQCFNLGNMPWGPIPFISLFGAVVLGLHRRAGGMLTLYRRLRAAYARGRESRCLAHVIWEEHWPVPLHRVQQLLCGT